MTSYSLQDALTPLPPRRASIAGTGSAAMTPHPYAPPRSNLEQATSFEPLFRSPTAQQSISYILPAPLQDLFAQLRAQQEAQDAENKRRREWECQLELAAAARQAQAERTISEMREEIEHLRAALHASQQRVSYHQENGLLTPYHSSSSVEPMPSHYHSVTPLSPISRQATFASECGDNFSASSQAADSRFASTFCDRMSPDSGSMQGVSSQSSPNASSVSPGTSPSPTALHFKSKRRGRSLTPSSRDSDASSTSSRSRTRPPRKRMNTYDKRCLTIQHAMRAHFWRMLGVEPDDKLPESHTEGVPLEPHQPVRFVWDKTTKQSIHNGRMKLRVLADIKEHRHLYKHVSSKDFGKKALDNAFEQCFTTFRQKFRAQNDVAIALQNKKREEAKARKSRHVSRRKTKLNNRAESRMKLPEFDSTIFDQALQIECMSSEESDFEDGVRSSDTLRTRGYAWRSSRLIRFYHALDREEMSDKSMKPKRGAGKRDRIPGPNKENDVLPPKGVATWMISRRWLKRTRISHPEVAQALDNLIDHSITYDLGRFHILGEETELSDEDTQDMKMQEPGLTMYQFPIQPPLEMPVNFVGAQYRSTSSSLEHALLQ